MKLTEKLVAELFLPLGEPEYVVSDADTTGLYSACAAAPRAGSSARGSFATPAAR